MTSAAETTALRLWSPQQEAVFNEVKYGTGTAVVRARAGTGKTTTLIESLNFVPESYKQISITRGARVLVCAYNKIIAEELKRRAPNFVRVSTLHSFGYNALLKSWGSAPKASGKILIDDGRDRRMLHQAFKKAGFESPRNLKLLLEVITECKTRMWTSTSDIMLLDLGVKELVPLFVSPQEALPLPDPTPKKRAPRRKAGEPKAAPKKRASTGRSLAVPVAKDVVAEIVLSAIRASCKPELNELGHVIVSYDDMVFIPAVFPEMVPSFDFVFVDETQDMNPAQLQLARNASRKGRMMIIGDDRQCIYHFNGADIGFMDRMVETGAKELLLTVTFRCPRRVVELAKLVVPDLEAAPDAREGRVEVCAVEFLGEVRVQPFRIGDAVLSRFNAPMVPLALRALNKGFKVKIRGKNFAEGLPMLIENLLSGNKSATLRDLQDAATDMAESKEHELDRLRREDDPPPDVDAKIAQIEEAIDRAEVLANLCAYRSITAIPQLFNLLDSLFTKDDGDASDGIVFSTVHQSKGLEWNRVYLLAWTFSPERSAEEENLWYVALTRTKSELWFVVDDENDKNAIESDKVNRAVRSVRWGA
jgi:superfamily I DNA/RNA helicase